MKYIFSIILALTVTHSVFSQICRDDIRRLGELAEPKRFEYVGYSKDAYYEITHEENAAFLICGDPVNIPVGSVVNLTGTLWKGSYNGMTGTWCETLIDINGTNVTRVYFLISDLKKLSGKPDKEIFSDKAGDNIRVNKFLKGFYIFLFFIGIIIVLEISRYLLWVKFVSRNKIINYTIPKPQLSFKYFVTWSIIFTVVVYIYLAATSKGAGLGIAVLFFSIPAGFIVAIVERVFRSLPTLPETIVCPKCRSVYVRNDILTKKELTGHKTVSISTTNSGTIYDNSGRSVGSFSQVVPGQGLRETFKYFFICKPCGYDWVVDSTPSDKSMWTPVNKYRPGHL